MNIRDAKCVDAKRIRAFVLALAAFAWLGLACHAEDRKLQKRVPPVYPELAKRMHIGGIVRVQATVAPDGTVSDVKILTGNKLLSQAAEEAVRKWKFAAGDSESAVNIDISFDVSN
ncbi:MAG: energy transducer TonB [Silvibacterium sp.]|nr:energy transducer TonB [Silvibacterium sp.]